MFFYRGGTNRSEHPRERSPHQPNVCFLAIGKATLESHPALPQDRARHEEIRAILDSALTADMAVYAVRLMEIAVTNPITREIRARLIRGR